jgi:protein-S-isoprenylcysteine O-methyltransferase Ste14
MSDSKRISKVSVGNVLFHYRNGIGPVVYIVALVFGTPMYPWGRADLNALLDVAGMLVAGAGQLLRIVTIGYDYIERGGKNRRVHASKLVRGGVFNHCRNPMYVGNILISAGLALIVHSLAFYLVLLAVIAAYVCIVAAEEDFLQRRFGGEYADYQRHVSRWWPRWAGWSASIEDMRFSWGRVLVKEYNTFFLLVLAIVAFKLWADYSVVGGSALPPSTALSTALVAWLLLYVLVRTLKKRGHVTG